MLNVFYEEPEHDRWLRYDRFPRKIVRRIIRGKPRVGGQMRVFLNLSAGLRRLKIDHRINDYSYIKRNPRDLACIIGKPVVLGKLEWKNPILFGASGYSHPIDDPDLLNRLPVRKVLVPGPWFADMCRPIWGDAVAVWPVGIDADLWRPASNDRKSVDVLLYNKIQWDREGNELSLLGPIRRALSQYGRSMLEIRYGDYEESQFLDLLRICKTMVFICEHETQGIAYQQALACGTPIFAWDRGGWWRDPAYFPHRVKFRPVTSVPYWDERCGLTFSHAADFEGRWHMFWDMFRSGRFDPRAFILENLTLEKAAAHYCQIAESVI